EAATLARMQKHLVTILTGIVAAPAQRWTDLPLLSEAERQQLLVDWNASVAGVRGQGSGVRSFASDAWLPTSDAACLHRLFAAQVERTPDAIAIVCGDQTKDERRKTNDEGSDSSFVLRPSSIVHLTYAELNTRAKHLAHLLRSLGVGPD